MNKAIEEKFRNVLRLSRYKQEDFDISEPIKIQTGRGISKRIDIKKVCRCIIKYRTSSKFEVYSYDEEDIDESLRSLKEKLDSGYFDK